MDKTIRLISTMLQSPDGMRRCAAAMVLAELAPKESEVVKALGATLKDANQMLTRYILEAFEKIGHRSVVPFVLPLLDAPDIETKLRAAGIIAGVGGEMVSELKRQFTTATPPQKRVLVEILARIHSREAFQIVLETLFDPDTELARESCEAVRRNIGDATPKQRVQLHRQVVSFMGAPRVRKDERVLTHCLLLIGHLGAPEYRRLLLKYTAPRNPSFMRRNALIGLKGQTFTGAALTQVAGTLFKYLAEPDWLNIVQHGLELLEKLPLPKSTDAQFRRLLDNKHPSVRNFAARRLAANDNAATNALLMKLLAHDDPQVSEIAAGALARHKGATKLLLAALARERKSDKAWRFAKILKPHSATVDKAAIRKFQTLAARDLEAADPRHEALLYFLRNIDPNRADTVVRDVGLKFKKARKWQKAIDCLHTFAHHDTFDGELRYELSLCNLKQSAKDFAPHLRAEDPALRDLQVLVPDKKFRLLDRLRKEKALDPADLFYAGFHFAEGVGDERVFGQHLLQHVAKKWPRAKEAKAAREKLKLTTPGA